MRPSGTIAWSDRPFGGGFVCLRNDRKDGDNMTVKNLSTRMQICGRGTSCHGGHSAIEQSSYIGSTTLYSEYDGQTYYPKYSEDLVHSEVMLPKNAPLEYKDPYVLWNSVEMIEKGANAQLARTFRVCLPNEWSYELAINVMQDYIKRNFVDNGMCAQFAIHDSENKKTGQRNLHCHILLTLRSIDENEQWMAKQRKEYLTDKNGERIPLIDKKTGRQKVDSQNRKQCKCISVPTNDWNKKENARKWRKDLADTINEINSRIGLNDNYWEFRSFEEQGLDIIPQIHLGEKASAMERAGIRTIRGDINRDIIARNAVIDSARAAYEKAKENLKAIKAVPVTVVKAIKNEIIDMIREIAKRNNNKLSLPIMSGKFLGKVSDRSLLQNKDKMESFVQKMGWTAFKEMRADKISMEEEYESLKSKRLSISKRISYLEHLLYLYSLYEPYIKNHKELWALNGWARKKYEREHMISLGWYDTYRSALKEAIVEDDKKIDHVKWQKELDQLKARYEKTQKPYSSVVWGLAATEVLEHSKRDLERMLENESHKKTVDFNRSK